MDQLVINALAAGCAYALIAVGFSTIYTGCRFLHVAHAATYTAGPYIVYFFSHSARVPFPLACMLGVAGSSLLGMIMEIMVYRPLRRRSASSLVLLVASLGLFVVLQDTISLVFGSEARVLHTALSHPGMRLMGAVVTGGQSLIMGATVVVSVLALPVLRFTDAGRTYRAVATDPELARIRGVDVDHTVLSVMVIGSALAGLAGIIVGYDLDLTPRMGFHALLMGIVASVVGGLGSVPGAMLGGLLIGLIQNLVAWSLPTQWQEALVLLVLLLFLVVRPQGVLGRRLRTEQV